MKHLFWGIVIILTVSMTAYSQLYSGVEIVTTKSGKSIPTLKKAPKKSVCPKNHSSNEYWTHVRALPVTVTAIYEDYEVFEWEYKDLSHKTDSTGYFFAPKGVAQFKLSKLQTGKSYVMLYCEKHRVAYTYNTVKLSYENISRNFWKNIRVLPIKLISRDLDSNYVYWKYMDKMIIKVGSFYIDPNMRVALDGKMVGIKDLPLDKPYVATYLETDFTLYGLSVLD